MGHEAAQIRLPVALPPDPTWLKYIKKFPKEDSTV